MDFNIVDAFWDQKKWTLKAKYIDEKKHVRTMILYYNKPESEEEQINIYVDFSSIYARVKHHYRESTLYRLLRKRCHSSIRYQNRDLYPYADIMNIPEIAKELKRNG